MQAPIVFGVMAKLLFYSRYIPGMFISSGRSNLFFHFVIGFFPNETLFLPSTLVAIRLPPEYFNLITLSNVGKVTRIRSYIFCFT